MSAAFEERIESADTNNTWNLPIGDIITKYSDFFKMYTTYVGNQSNQNQITNSYLKEKSFQLSLLRNCPEFESRSVVVLSFNSYLIKPIQRICKYPLLLRELLKYTPNDHFDHENLEKAFNQLQSITLFINKKKKESENYLKLLEIHEIVSDLPKNFNLFNSLINNQISTMIMIDHHMQNENNNSNNNNNNLNNQLNNLNELNNSNNNRIFIREANLVKISKGRAQERHFYLFNDIILYCAKPIIKSTNRLFFKGKILLQMLLVNDLPDTPERKFTFEIVRLDHKKKKYIICAKDLNEKNDWMNDISNLVKGYLDEDYKNRHHPKEEEKGILKQIRECSEELENVEKIDISNFDNQTLMNHLQRVSNLQEKLTNLKKNLNSPSLLH